MLGGFHLRVTYNINSKLRFKETEMLFWSKIVIREAAMANATLAQKEKERQQMMRADQPFLLPQTPTRPSASLWVPPFFSFSFFNCYDFKTGCSCPSFLACSFITSRRHPVSFKTIYNAKLISIHIPNYHCVQKTFIFWVLSNLTWFSHWELQFPFC